MDTWDWDAFISLQPPVVHEALHTLKDAARIIEKRDLRRVLRDVATPVVEKLLKKHASVEFLVRSPSHALSTDLFFRANKGNAVITSALAKGRIRLVKDSLQDNNLVKDSNHLIILEDAVYSGGAVAKISVEFPRATIILPFSTDIALHRIRSTHLKHLIIVGQILPTIFDGLTAADVLKMDVYFQENGEMKYYKSYLFDVLQLDDRQTLHLMRHKMCDVSMAPFTLLNVGPTFPPGTTRVYKIKHPKEVAASFPTKRNASRNALLASKVALNFEKYDKKEYRIPKMDGVNTPVVPAGTCEYRENLKLFNQLNPIIP